MQFYMSPSLDGTLPESVTVQENNSLLTLYIDFLFLFFFLNINTLINKFQSCTITLLALIYLSTRVEEKSIFMKSKVLWNLCTVTLESNCSANAVTSQIVVLKVSPERSAYKKSTTLKMDYPNLPKLLRLLVSKSFSILLTQSA